MELENATRLADREKTFEERKLIDQAFKNHHIFGTLTERLKVKVINTMDKFAYAEKALLFK